MVFNTGPSGQYPFVPRYTRNGTTTKISDVYNLQLPNNQVNRFRNNKHFLISGNSDPNAFPYEFYGSAGGADFQTMNDNITADTTKPLWKNGVYYCKYPRNQTSFIAAAHGGRIFRVYTLSRKSGNNIEMPTRFAEDYTTRDTLFESDEQIIGLCSSDKFTLFLVRYPNNGLRIYSYIGPFQIPTDAMNLNFAEPTKERRTLVHDLGTGIDSPAFEPHCMELCFFPDGAFFGLFIAYNEYILIYLYAISIDGYKIGESTLVIPVASSGRKLRIGTVKPAMWKHPTGNEVFAAISLVLWEQTSSGLGTTVHAAHCYYDHNYVTWGFQIQATINANFAAAPMVNIVEGPAHGSYFLYGLLPYRSMLYVEPVFATNTHSLTWDKIGAAEANADFKAVFLMGKNRWGVLMANSTGVRVYSFTLGEIATPHRETLYNYGDTIGNTVSAPSVIRDSNNLYANGKVLVMASGSYADEEVPGIHLDLVYIFGTTSGIFLNALTFPGIYKLGDPSDTSISDKALWDRSNGC